ncbi:hypothetical protein HK097_008109 [Rhizophlyctis rosea]|uniref:FAS1 domain-containing protein n=1 Tax=Rhizophlyctis rosea TaxID=64517 RepID=A0AAD5SC81_9FUNG|nr:hypothetical protein HK097_008109 [Rhizophlyctis rosea]
MLVRTLFSALSLLGAASAATIAELVTQNAATAGKAAAAVASHPEWAQPGPHTLFIPTDAALSTANLPEGDLGSIFITGKTIDYRNTANGTDVYLILNDDKGVKRAVWDDYTWGPVPNPELHVRTGTSSGIAVSWLPADNGFLYILNTAIPDPAPPSVVGPRNNATTFFNLAKQAGIDGTIDNLKNVTIWAPSDEAFTAAQSQLASLTPDQLSYVLYSHITQQPTYSNLMFSGPRTSIIQGQSLTLTVGAGEGNSNIQGAPLPKSGADQITSVGVIQVIERVIVPASIPAGKPQLVAGVSEAPSVTTTTASGSTTTTGTLRGSGGTQTPGGTQTNVGGSSGAEKVGPAVLAAAAVMAGAVFGL